MRRILFWQGAKLVFFQNNAMFKIFPTSITWAWRRKTMMTKTISIFGFNSGKTIWATGWTKLAELWHGISMRHGWWSMRRRWSVPGIHASCSSACWCSRWVCEHHLYTGGLSVCVYYKLLALKYDYSFLSVCQYLHKIKAGNLWLSPLVFLTY